MSPRKSTPPAARTRAEPRAVVDFVTAVRRSIDDRELLKGGEHVLLAVSGGPDSMALLHCFHRLRSTYDLTLHVGHFDHRLRTGSDADARFVGRQARALEIPFTIGRADATQTPKGTSPEEAARSRRYGFLGTLAREIGATRIATGHTLDDQAETVLMRMLVGAGRRGLSGIPPKRWFTIRPMIDVRRAQVEAFCRALRLKPRIDPSNADPAFLRNLLRNDVLPLLTRTVNARLPESLHRLADIVRDEDYWMDTQASMAAVPEQTDEGSRLSIEALRAMPVPLQRRAIRLLARNEGPGIDHRNTEAVRRLALGSESGAQLHLPGPLNARVVYGFLVIGRAPSLAAPTSPVDLAVPGETDLLPWGIAVRSWISTERPTGWPDGRTVAVLDADRVTFPLVVRGWRNGDRFRPLGMSKEKKVGDFFTDEKVVREERDSVPIVVDDTGAIRWIVGYRIDDSARVTTRTRRHLWLEIEEGTA